MTIAMNGQSYRLQNNLQRSVGNPPDLTNIAPGNAFVGDVADGVIPTSICTAVTLNSTYAIMASTNLHHWVTITHVTSPTPLVRITAPRAPSFPRRFYRLVTP